MENKAYSIVSAKFGQIIIASNVDPAWLAKQLDSAKVIGKSDMERAKKLIS